MHCRISALGLLPRLDEIAVRTRKLTYSNHLGTDLVGTARPVRWP
jgi:hypothetical protein